MSWFAQQQTGRASATPYGGGGFGPRGGSATPYGPGRMSPTPYSGGGQPSGPMAGQARSGGTVRTMPQTIGGMLGPVEMRGPDGSTRRVPAQDVRKYQALGAEVVG